MRALSLSLAATLALSACSTAPPAFEQARHGASLISQLELSLAEFRRLEGHAERARRASIAEQLAKLAGIKATAAGDVRARQSAGDLATVAMMERLIADADALAAEAAAAQAAAKADATAVAGLLTALADTQVSTAAAQDKLAEMARELPLDVRLKELRSFAGEVQKAVKANRKKIGEAEAAAAASAAAATP